VNLTQLLGVVALVIGGGLLVSELVLGQTRLVEMTGTPLLSLRLFGAVVIVLGGIAFILGKREMQELNDVGGRPRR
jgi:hypothetical protein